MPGIQITKNNGLEVNDGPLLPESIAYLSPSCPSEPLEILRARYEQQGMLLLKGLLPREDVLRTRTKFFEMMSPSGVLQQNTEPVEGIFNSTRSPDDFPGIGAGAAGQNGRPGGESAQTFVNLAIEAHYEDWYTKDLAKHPALLDFVAKFTGWNENILGLNRSLLRNNVPGTKPIGVHYDQIFLRYGEPTSVTAWVPIGDVSLTGGGSMYLDDGTTPKAPPFGWLRTGAGNRRRSRSPNRSRIHQKGPRRRHDRRRSQECIQSLDQERNMMSTGLLSEYPLEFARQYNRRWLVSAYEAGDVVLHKPHAIHASTVNNDPNNVIRLATDLRFVDQSKPYDERWTHFYRFGDGV